MIGVHKIQANTNLLMHSDDNETYKEIQEVISLTEQIKGTPNLGGEIDLQLMKIIQPLKEFIKILPSSTVPAKVAVPDQQQINEITIVSIARIIQKILRSVENECETMNIKNPDDFKFLLEINFDLVFALRKRKNVDLAKALMDVAMKLFNVRRSAYAAEVLTESAESLAQIAGGILNMLDVIMAIVEIIITLKNAQLKNVTKFTSGINDSLALIINNYIDGSSNEAEKQKAQIAARILSTANPMLKGSKEEIQEGVILNISNTTHYVVPFDKFKAGTKLSEIAISIVKTIKVMNESDGKILKYVQETFEQLILNKVFLSIRTKHKERNKRRTDKGIEPLHDYMLSSEEYSHVSVARKAFNIIASKLKKLMNN